VGDVTWYIGKRHATVTRDDVFELSRYAGGHGMAERFLSHRLQAAQEKDGPTEIRVDDANDLAVTNFLLEVLPKVKQNRGQLTEGLAALWDIVANP
jgi:hypothetical protein